MRIAIFGCGHAGLVTGICLSSIGHHVVLFDQDTELLGSLEKARLPIYELHLDKLFQRSLAEHALSISTHWEEAASNAEIVFLCVTVPQLENGESDFAVLDSAAAQIARAENIPSLVVLRSTVPVQTGKQLKHILTAYCRKPDTRFRIAANPQFLREGTAVEDFLHPDRILLGTEDRFSEETLREVYRPLLTPGFRCPLHSKVCPSRKIPELILTTVHSAELIKHASNAFLAVKISYANVLADLCERLGGDIKEVPKAVGLDKRIGSKFLHPGPGFGGSCFPKDTAAAADLARQQGYVFEIIEATMRVNAATKARMIEKIADIAGPVRGRVAAILGLSFKPETDDVRESPALAVVADLERAGASVRAFDPAAMASAKVLHPNVHYARDAYDCADGADFLILATEWNEFRALDLTRLAGLLRSKTMIDLRNIYDPEEMRAAGWRYAGVGRA